MNSVSKVKLIFDWNLRYIDVWHRYQPALEAGICIKRIIFICRLSKYLLEKRNITAIRWGAQEWRNPTP
jgi:hypothetical protein